MGDEKTVTIYGGVANGWIAGCYQLVMGVALVGIELVSEKLVYAEDIAESNNKREISIRVDFLDDTMEIGRIILTRINQDKTYIQILLDPLPDKLMIMYDLRGKNGDLKKRFTKIQETAPTSMALVAETVRTKLSGVGLLND